MTTKKRKTIKSCSKDTKTKRGEDCYEEDMKEVTIIVNILLCSTPLEERRYSSNILDLGIRWTWLHAPAALPSGDLPPLPQFQLDRRLNGPQSRPGGGEENNLHLPGI
jgi:hypothetical protein